MGRRRTGLSAAMVVREGAVAMNDFDFVFALFGLLLGFSLIEVVDEAGEGEGNCAQLRSARRLPASGFGPVDPTR